MDVVSLAGAFLDYKPFSINDILPLNKFVIMMPSSLCKLHLIV